MILSTSSGDFPIPPSVARRLPNVPALPDLSAPNARIQLADFRDWLDASPEHAIDYERLRLAFFQGAAHSEIARHLDLPLGTVKSRIRKAMIKLRIALEPLRGLE